MSNRVDPRSKNQLDGMHNNSDITKNVGNERFDVSDKKSLPRAEKDTLLNNLETSRSISTSGNKSSGKASKFFQKLKAGFKRGKTKSNNVAETRGQYLERMTNDESVETVEPLSVRDRMKFGLNKAGEKIRKGFQKLGRKIEASRSPGKGEHRVGYTKLKSSGDGEEIVKSKTGLKEKFQQAGRKMGRGLRRAAGEIKDIGHRHKGEDTSALLGDVDYEVENSSIDLSANSDSIEGVKKGKGKGKGKGKEKLSLAQKNRAIVQDYRMRKFIKNNSDAFFGLRSSNHGKSWEKERDKPVTLGEIIRAKISNLKLNIKDRKLEKEIHKQNKERFNLVRDQLKVRVKNIIDEVNRSGVVSGSDDNLADSHKAMLFLINAKNALKVVNFKNHKDVEFVHFVADHFVNVLDWKDFKENFSDKGLEVAKSQFDRAIDEAAESEASSVIEGGSNLDIAAERFFEISTTVKNAFLDILTVGENKIRAAVNSGSQSSKESLNEALGFFESVNSGFKSFFAKLRRDHPNYIRSMDSDPIMEEADSKALEQVDLFSKKITEDPLIFNGLKSGEITSDDIGSSVDEAIKFFTTKSGELSDHIERMDARDKLAAANFAKGNAPIGSEQINKGDFGIDVQRMKAASTSLKDQFLEMNEKNKERMSGRDIPTSSEVVKPKVRNLFKRIAAKIKGAKKQKTVNLGKVESKIIKQIKKLDMSDPLDRQVLAEVASFLENTYEENLMGMSTDNFSRLVDSSSREVISESFGNSTFYNTGKVDELEQ